MFVGQRDLNLKNKSSSELKITERVADVEHPEMSNGRKFYGFWGYRRWMEIQQPDARRQIFGLCYKIMQFILNIFQLWFYLKISETCSLISFKCFNHIAWYRNSNEDKVLRKWLKSHIYSLIGIVLLQSLLNRSKSQKTQKNSGVRTPPSCFLLSSPIFVNIASQ